MTSALLIATVSFAQFARANTENAQNYKSKFVGAWRLASIEEKEADGKFREVKADGLLTYAEENHMALQVRYLRPEKMAPSPK